MNETLVLGYDGSESATAALDHTVRLASRIGAHVVVVFAYYVTPLAGGEAAHDYRRALEEVGERDLARAVADLEAAGVETSTRIGQGKPADVILAAADEVDAGMIVVGTEGENPITGALLGSVVLKLVQRSSRPLLVVPTPDSE
jgi:nucleotide-binding universal stress UspA family protein